MNAQSSPYDDSYQGPLDDTDQLLEIGERGQWFRMNDFRVDIARRKPVARVLWALAEGARATPGVPVPTKALIEAAWPGEIIVRHAAQIRLRVAIATLRASGLARRIVTGRGGYMIEGPIEIEGPGEPSAVLAVRQVSGVSELASTEGCQESEEELAAALAMATRG